jgi:hypothetical protein
MSSVGQALGGIVGGVVGFFVGGPTGALYGAQIGMGVGGLIDPPKGPNINGPRLSDLSVQTSTYGVPIPRVYGTIATHGNVIWIEGDKLKEVDTKTKHGGKGGGGGATTTTYSYFATFAVGLCKGPIAGVRRIWVGANLIYDAGADDLESIIASNKASEGFAVYLGTDDQQPEPRMQADKGVANTPAYRGLAYIVFYDLALKDYGNSLQAAQVKVEIAGAFSEQTRLIDSGEVAKSSMAHPSNFGCGLPLTDRADAIFLETTPVGQPFVVSIVRSRAGFTTRSPLQDLSAAAWKSLSGISSSLISLQFAVEYDLRFLAFGDEQNQTLVDMGSNARVEAFAEGSSALYSAVNVSFGTTRKLVKIVQASGSWVITDEAILTSSEVPILAAWNEKLVIAQKSTGTGNLLLVRIYDEALQAIDEFSVSVIADHDIDSSDCAGIVIGDDFYIVSRATTSNGVINRIDLIARTHTGNWNPVTNFTETERVPRKPCVTAVGRNVIAWGSVRAGDKFGYVRWQIDGLSSLETIDLSSIVQNEALQSNILVAQDLDVASLTQSVRGYRVTQTGAIRGALEPLQAAWPFDAVQSGYKIAFRSRGASAVASVSAGQLDARVAGAVPGTQLTIAREMDTQIPRRVVVRYLDTAREYDISEQAGERLSTDSIHLREVELPIVLTATEAAGMAEVLLYLYWLERREVSFRLPPLYRYLEPADVITVTGEWGQYELRLTTVHLMSDGRLECQARYNAASIYTPTAQGEEGASVGKPIALAGPSYYALLDVPLMRDQDDEAGFPVAMAGYTTGWPGGILFRSPDGGQTWTALQGFDGPATLGFARTALAAGRTDIIDAASLLQVDMLAGELESVTELAMLSGANYFALGADGRWEIIAANTCELQADGSYILRDFLRGRFGTESAMTTHQAGDVLVLLTDPDLAWIGMDVDAIGLARNYRGITSGRTIDTDGDRSFTYRAVNLEPLSPVYLNGSRHPASGDWSLSWIRRGRVSPTWRNNVDVPLGEASEAYEVEIYDGASYATIKRTIAVTAASASYTGAQQVTDFGANQGTLYLRVYQLSATVGRGYPLQTSITR